MLRALKSQSDPADTTLVLGMMVAQQVDWLTIKLGFEPHIPTMHWLVVPCFSPLLSSSFPAQLIDLHIVKLSFRYHNVNRTPVPVDAANGRKGLPAACRV